MKWRRHRGDEPGISGGRLADTWQVVSLLLDYPDEVLVERVPMLRDVVAELPDAQREPLTEFLDTLEGGDLGALQREYVDTFDVTRKCSLHLTYFTQGDTRRRGVALVEFKQAYRRAGVEFDTDAELPDHLCVVLEFGAVQDWADRVAPADPAPGRHRGAQGRSRAPRLAVAAGARGAALDAAGARRRRRGGPAAASSPRARRRRRSGSSRTRSTPASTPDPNPPTRPRCSARPSR